jgi:hypothetical protein
MWCPYKLQQCCCAVNKHQKLRRFNTELLPRCWLLFMRTVYICSLNDARRVSAHFYLLPGPLTLYQIKIFSQLFAAQIMACSKLLPLRVDATQCLNYLNFKIFTYTSLYGSFLTHESCAMPV